MSGKTSSSKTILLFYRYFLKNDQANKTLIRPILQSNTISGSNSNHLSSKYVNFMGTYITMRKRLRREKELLNSYNINLQRVDQMKKIEDVAKYVGLRLTNNKNSS